METNLTMRYYLKPTLIGKIRPAHSGPLTKSLPIPSPRIGAIPSMPHVP